MGPRQSGKTTLCRKVFPEHAYVNLEAVDVSQAAREDPRGFLDRFADGVILDEIQRVPSLTSYVMQRLDESEATGRFIFTGSQNVLATAATSQSLAGRVAVLELLPFEWEELRVSPAAPEKLDNVLWTGGYPPIVDQGLSPSVWHQGYATTYLERDVRQILNIGDLSVFQTFLALCAGRVGTEINLSQLGGDVGISYHTAQSWLSVLEASYIVFRLPPWHRNLGKRLVKRRKLYFWDTGLACALLGIRDPADLRTHPLRGPLFESWVVSELLKSEIHRGSRPMAYFYRDRARNEVDLLIERGGVVLAVEAKAGATVVDGFFKGLRRFDELASESLPGSISRAVVYGGEDSYRRAGAEVVSWRDIGRLDPG